MKRTDITGQTFNYLTAIKFSHYSDNKKACFWCFKCVCGKEKLLNLYEVRRNKIKSCGCKRNNYNETLKQERIYLKCPICGKEFYKRKSEICTINYCSRKCYQKSLKTNEYLTEGEITKIIINNKVFGKVECLIDTKNIKLVKDFCWSLEGKGLEPTECYVSHRGRNIKSIKIHRLIKNVSPDMEIDHKDNNRLNNLESNLRECTRGLNAQNLRINNKNNKTSGFKNIYWNNEKGKWAVTIKINRKIKHIGYFRDLQDAKNAASAARTKYHPFSKENL